MRRLLFLVIAAMGMFKGHSQALVQTYTDRCTGEVKVFSVEMGGQTVVAYYNKSRVFTSTEFINGTLQAWLEETYAWWQALSPCSTNNATSQTTQQTTSQATTNATNAASNATSNATQNTGTANTGTTNTGSTNTNTNGNTGSTNTGSTSSGSGSSSSSSGSSSGSSSSGSSGGENGNSSSSGGDSSGSSGSSDSSGGDSGSTGNDSSGGDGSGDSGSDSGSSGSDDSSGDNSSDNDSSSSDSDNSSGDGDSSDGDSSGEEGGDSDSKSEESKEDSSDNENKEESSEEKSDEESKEEVDEEESKEESDESSEEESEEESDEEESSDEESEDEDEDEEQEESNNEDEEEEDEDEKEKRLTPPIVTANLVTMQMIDGVLTNAASFGYSQSSLTGETTYAANAMVWSNLKQYSINISQSDVYFNWDKEVPIMILDPDSGEYFEFGSYKDRGTIMMVQSVSAGYMRMFSTHIVTAGISNVYLGQKENFWKGFVGGIAATGMGVFLEGGNVVTTAAFTAFGSKPFNFKKFDRVTISPMLAYSMTPATYDFSSNKVTWSEHGNYVIGSNFDFNLTQRFKANIGGTLIGSTIPGMPLSWALTVGSRFQF